MDRLRQNLRDSYVQLKDLNSRCLIDMSNIEKSDKRIFYFKPKSILMEDPEKQKLYREKIIKSFSSAPPIQQNPVLAEEMSQEMISTMRDMSEPDIVREQLAQFYQRRIYNIQHKKYRVLLRWAHFALTSEYLDRIGHHGTFTFGRLQYELENSIKRYERLSQDDDYGNTRDGNIKRPKTKGNHDEISTSMYNENPRKDPLSCIRMDDFEVYLRAQTYELKLFRTCEKFIGRVKWIPVAKRYDIFKETHLRMKSEQEKLFEEFKEYERNVRNRFDNSSIKKSDDLIVQMEEIFTLHYPTNFTPVHNFSTKAPIPITNFIELQYQILRRSSEFKIFGDIEIDEGHSFTYQVNIFFTTYYQKQIIKSQFSLYDATVRDMKDAYESNEPPDEDLGDINEITRRNLKSLMLIDFQMVDQMNSNMDQNNLFLLKKGKKINDQISELRRNFSDIKVIRLKKAHWLSEVMLKPNVDPMQRKVNAFLSYDYMPDLLLSSVADFVDINDMATTNTIFHDLAQIYIEMQKKQDSYLTRVDNIVKSSLLSDQQAKNLLLHFKSALKLDNSQNSHQEQSEARVSKSSSLRELPKHYIQALFTLRHMKMKDTKTKILYCINFFRSVQKRMCLDLREFSGKEVVSEQVETVPAQEATYLSKAAQTISGNISYQLKPGDEERDKNLRKELQEQAAEKKSQEEQKKQDKNEDEGEIRINQYDKQNLLDMRKWKLNNRFHNQMISTCPVVPRFHVSHGEPLQDKFIENQDILDSNATTKTHITKKSSSYLNRMDEFIVLEESKEIYVLDDFGMHLMYDCSLEDMAQLDKEMVKIGTYFVKKNETKFDFKDYKFPIVERFQLMEDLLEHEFEFQFSKAKLIMLYLESYEHICDPLEQQRMMQIITDLISTRPRIDCQKSEYFIESYRAEVARLETLLSLMKEMSHYLMRNEKKENQHMKEYLQMTYKIANSYVNKQWSDVNQEELKKEVKSRQVIQGGMRYNDIQEMQEALKDEPQKPSKPVVQEKDQDNNVDKFAEILGLKGTSMENMMKMHIKSDEVTEEILSQDANFIKTQEGYPIFIREHNDALSKVKFTTYSQEIGVLDFYESLTCIPKVLSAITTVFPEVSETLIPASILELVNMETIYLEKCFVEFKKSVGYSEDELIEYKGSQFIENDLIMSSPDKLMFLIKDMVAHLTRTYKKNLNPFFVSKLDFFTVHNFQFQDMLKEQMSSQQRVDVNFTRNFIETQLSSKGGVARFFPKLREDDRKVNVPPMLLIFCNLIEVMRLRETMIVSLSETQVLSEVYINLRDLVYRNNYKLQFQNPLVFETFTVAKDQINFIEDGSLTDVDIDLAINEFDPNLRSNLNFMNTESVQCLMLDNGLAELRAATHYQTMHKQVLLVAVRTNLKYMDLFLRAQAELELLQQHPKLKLTNPIVDIKPLFKGLNNQLNEEGLVQMKSRLLSTLTYDFGDQFIQILPLKTQARSIVEKRFKHMLHQLSGLKETYHDIESVVVQLPPYSIARLMRDYKISLLHCYCVQVSQQNVVEATRLEIMGHSMKLKKFMNLFPKEIGLFKLQQNETKELQFQNQYFDKMNDCEESQDYFTNIETGEIHSLLTIPSFKTIMFMPSHNLEEKTQQETQTAFDGKMEEKLEFKLDIFRKNQLEEMNLKHKQAGVIQQLCRRQAYDIANLQNSMTLGRMSRLMKTLVDLVELKFFFSKLNMNPVEAIELEMAANSMQPYWTQDLQQQQLEDQLLLHVDDEQLSERIMRKLIDEKKRRQEINDELETLSQKLRSVFARMLADIVTQTMSESLEYLGKQVKCLHYRMLGGILCTLDSFYLKKKPQSAIENLLWVMKETTGIDLAAPVFSNGTIINFKEVDYIQRQLYHPLKQDFQQFEKTVKGLKNEENFISSEVQLIENIFSHVIGGSGKIKANYVGQEHFDQYSYLSKEEIEYMNTTCAQNDQTIKQLLELDKIINDASIYSLQKRTNYLLDIIKAKVIYFSLIIVFSKNSLGFDSREFLMNRLPTYKHEVQWKIENEFQKKLNKRMMKQMQKPTTGGPGGFRQNFSDDKVIKQSIAIQENAIQRAIRQQSSPNQKIGAQMMIGQESKELMTQHVRQGQIMLKATVKMGQREFERRLIKAAIEAISKQVSAISKCLEMASKNLDQGVGLNSQHNFAPTFTDHVQPNHHLESINKMSSLQVFLTRMRNRGMDIETLTSGPGIVFTYKDLNECLQQFCNDIVGFQEKELKSRTTMFYSMINHQNHLLYIKDTRLDNQKKKMKFMHDNISRIVNSRIYEKGNALIFELDKSLRDVRFYQDHIFVFEKEMKEFVQEEFRQLLQKKDYMLDLQKKAMHDVSSQMIQEVKAHMISEQKRIKKQIKTTSRKMRDMDGFKQTQQQNAKRRLGVTEQQPINFNSQSQLGNTREGEEDLNIRPEEWAVSPEQAHNEMLEMQKLLFKQRSFWMLKFQSQKRLYQDEIQTLKHKLTSNTALWEQLQEQDKKGKILQQELIFTQKSLSQCEKIIEKLKEELRQSETERIRLFQYKQNKAQRLEELESQIKKIDISEHINISKVIELLSTKDKELTSLKKNERTYEERVQKIIRQGEKEKAKAQKKLEKEVDLKSQAIQKMNTLKDEMKGFEGGLNSDQSSLLWKQKCKELLDICQNLANENQTLANRLQVGFSEGIQESLKSLTNAIHSQQVEKAQPLELKDQATEQTGTKSRNKTAQRLKPNENLFGMHSSMVLPQIRATNNQTPNESAGKELGASHIESGTTLLTSKLQNMIPSQGYQPFQQEQLETSMRSEYQNLSDYYQNNYQSYQSESQDSLLGNLLPIKPIKQIGMSAATRDIKAQNSAQKKNNVLTIMQKRNSTYSRGNEGGAYDQLSFSSYHQPNQQQTLRQIREVSGGQKREHSALGIVPNHYKATERSMISSDQKSLYNDEFTLKGNKYSRRNL